MKLRPGKTYTFAKLEEYMEGRPGVFLLVENIQYGDRAIMHIFMGNFCGDWLSGDGVLFYADGEVHSANEGDEFKLISLHHPGDDLFNPES